jgi:hypothetical protein
MARIDMQVEVCSTRPHGAHEKLTVVMWQVIHASEHMLGEQHSQEC